MARIAPLPGKRPPRPSLARIGIPDGRDVLAVYLWWVKQRYYRAAGLVERTTRNNSDSGPDSEDVAEEESVRSVFGQEDRELGSEAVGTRVEMKRVGFDVFGVGGQFE
ncbi:hypothetical protein CC78DRAFT_548059 [Lojkania enalia]|uniref:Uncharacterized protein n=1 Tax=Lojkania enalia TaxID=147567 RepID=A0A9P4MYX6_9PLEO|nr:hypothetical protein CC78DRAFT_548059 [Didymosphaeria enalia]